jgi:predicted GH43/DUF377 family glycosyl hydrolase
MRRELAGPDHRGMTPRPRPTSFGARRTSSPRWLSDIATRTPRTRNDAFALFAELGSPLQAIPAVAANPLIVRHPANPVLSAGQLPYPAHAVFNPAAARVGDEVRLLARVEDFRGRSHLALARSADGRSGWAFDPSPVLAADPDRFPEDAFGIEDARTVWLPELETHAITFTSYSRQGPCVSLALSPDLTTFERRGVIRPPDDKDAALLPRRFGGDWLMVHRPSSRDPLEPAHIVMSRSSDLVHWGDTKVILTAREGGWWDANKVGLGPPPLETPAGWLIMYHGVRTHCSGALYRSGLALFDLDEPWRLIGRTDEWIFGPETAYERTGDVPNVVFPSGWVLDETGDRVLIYYGAADTTVGLAEARLDDLVRAATS